jgi:hypothetical protein
VELPTDNEMEIMAVEDPYHLVFGNDYLRESGHA